MTLNALTSNNYTKIKGRKSPDHIYYIQMRNLQKRNNINYKNRMKIIEEKLSHIQNIPIINQNTIDIILFLC